MSFDLMSGSISSKQQAASRQAMPTAVAVPYPQHAQNRVIDQVVRSPRIHRRTLDRATTAPISLSIVSGLLRGYDAAAILAAGLAAFGLAAPDLSMPASYYIALSLFGAVVGMNTLHLSGSYRLEVLRQRRVAWSRVLGAWAASTAVMALALFASSGAVEQNWVWLLLWFTIGLFLPLTGRGVLAMRMDYWRKAGRLRRRVAILGAGPAGQALLRRIVGRREKDAVVVGLYDDRPAQSAAGWRGHIVRGNGDDLIEDIRRGRIDMVLIATPTTDSHGLEESLARLRCVAVDVCVCPDPYGLNLSEEHKADLFCGVPLICVERRMFRDWEGVVKTLEDRIFAAAIILLISPLLAAIAIAIKLETPGPVIFRQKRYGLNNQLIEVFKFRSMYHEASDPNATQLTRRNDPRVTRIGAFIRRTSLDELPQFFNVLLGDMSVVGPRPHATLCKAGGVLYQDAVQNYDWRHRVKPGITGWAQVNGWRGETETVEQIRKRVEHDIYYIKNWSLLLDVQIILRTIFGGFTGTKAY